MKIKSKVKISPMIKNLYFVKSNETTTFGIDK